MIHSLTHTHTHTHTHTDTHIDIYIYMYIYIYIDIHRKAWQLMLKRSSIQWLCIVDIVLKRST